MAGASRTSARATHAVMRAPVTYADLVQDLLWPRVFRAAGLALSPTRLGLSLFAVVALLAVDRGWHAVVQGGDAASAPGPISTAIGFAVGRLTEAATALVRLDGHGLAEAVYGLCMAGPAGVLRDQPWAMLLLLPFCAVVLALAGGAISRSAACEFALNVKIPWTEAVGFALTKWRSLVGAAAAPLLAVWVISALLCAVGWVMQAAVLNILGALAFGLVLTAGMLAAAAMIGFAAAHPLLIGAVSCEGTDGYDAVQRAYSYTLNRFGRLALYMGVLLVQGLIAVTVATAVVVLLLTFVERTTGVGVGPGPGMGDRVPMVVRAVNDGAPVIVTEPPGEPLPPLRVDPPAETRPAKADGEPKGWTDRLALRIARLWSAIPLALVSAFTLSLYVSGSTVVYLLMRQVCDGQDPGDLWMPGMVEGTLTPSAQGEGSAAPGGVDADQT